MVTDRQVGRMLALVETGKTLTTAAAKAGMDPQTARKYRRLGKLPSEVSRPHGWRTRGDPFAEVWGWCQGLNQIRGTPYLFRLLVGLASGLFRFQRAVEQAVELGQEVLVSQRTSGLLVMLKLHPTCPHIAGQETSMVSRDFNA